MKTTKYPLYSKKNELIGEVELDNVYNGGLHSSDLVILAYTTKFEPYEISAWQVSRIINFSDPSMPKTYGRLEK